MAFVIWLVFFVDVILDLISRNEAKDFTTFSLHLRKKREKENLFLSSAFELVAWCKCAFEAFD
ncbi:hypothetical protein, partial [Clostridium tertium]